MRARLALFCSGVLVLAGHCHEPTSPPPIPLQQAPHALDTAVEPIPALGPPAGTVRNLTAVSAGGVFLVAGIARDRVLASRILPDASLVDVPALDLGKAVSAASSDGPINGAGVGAQFLVAWADSNLDGGSIIRYSLIDVDAGLLTPGGVELRGSGQPAAPSVAAANSGWLLSWWQTEDDGGASLVGARVDPSGALREPPFSIVTGALASGSNEAFCTQSRCLVGWQGDLGLGALSLGIWAAQLDFNTRAVGPFRQLSPVSSYGTSLAIGPIDGGFLTVWSDSRPFGSANLWASRLDFADTLLDPDGGFLFSTGTNGRYHPKACAPTPTATVVAWADWRLPQVRPFARAYTTSLRPELDIVNASESDLYERNRPGVAASGTAVLFAWDTGWSESTGPRFIRAGYDTVTGALTRVDDAGILALLAPSSQRRPALAPTPSGYLLSWSDYRADAGVFVVRLQRDGGGAASPTSTAGLREYEQCHTRVFSPGVRAVLAVDCHATGGRPARGRQLLELNPATGQVSGIIVDAGSWVFPWPAACSPDGCLTRGAGGFSLFAFDGGLSTVADPTAALDAGIRQDFFSDEALAALGSSFFLTTRIGGVTTVTEFDRTGTPAWLTQTTAQPGQSYAGLFPSTDSVLLLHSDQASHLTLQVFTRDGGRPLGPELPLNDVDPLLMSSAAYTGQDWAVPTSFDGGLELWYFSRTGEFLAAIPLGVSSMGIEDPVRVGCIDSSSCVLAYAKPDVSMVGHPPRVVTRPFSGLDLGKSCGSGSDCPLGVCVDGVCCDVVCGDSDPRDCQACSVATGALIDGRCARLPGTTACRGSSHDCDLAEYCDGLSAACPTDSLQADGTACDGGMCAAGVCLDTGCSGGTCDGGAGDAGGLDPDAGGVDAGATDAGVTDAGVTDAGVTDAGVTDAGATDAGANLLPAWYRVGCGCHAAGSGSALWFLSGLLHLARRRGRTPR